MFWSKRSKAENEAIAVVTSDGRTVADGNLSFQTKEVRELLEAIRETSGKVRRANPKTQRRRRALRAALLANR